jgi:hypothetical protein
MKPPPPLMKPLTCSSHATFCNRNFNAEMDASKQNVTQAEDETRRFAAGSIETFQRDRPSQDFLKKSFAAQDDDGLEASVRLPPPPPTRPLPRDPTRRQPLPQDPDPTQQKAEPSVEDVPVSEGAVANEGDAAPSESNGRHDEDWYQRTFASELNELPVGNEFETSSIVSGFSRSGAEDLSGFTSAEDMHQRALRSARLSCGCLAFVLWLSCVCLVVVLRLSCGCFAFVSWLSCVCLVVALRLSCGCRAFVLWLSCGCLVVVVW